MPTLIAEKEVQTTANSARNPDGLAFSSTHMQSLNSKGWSASSPKVLFAFCTLKISKFFSVWRGSLGLLLLSCRSCSACLFVQSSCHSWCPAGQCCNKQISHFSRHGHLRQKIHTDQTPAGTASIIIPLTAHGCFFQHPGLRNCWHIASIVYHHRQPHKCLQGFEQKNAQKVKFWRGLPFNVL